LIKKEPFIPEPVPPKHQEEKKIDPEQPKKEISEKTAKTDRSFAGSFGAEDSHRRFL